MLRKLFSNPSHKHFQSLTRFVNLTYKHTSVFRKDAFPNNFIYSKQVKEALLNHQPVVALESTIISHGMPYPQNVDTAVQVESIIRKNGSVPATIAILEGRIHVGLSPSNLEKLGRMGSAAKKTSRRDLAMVVSQGLTGATTVSSTMLLAHQAGIKIFVTGGIGGVHRGAESSMDISADLTELGRTPVVVVCAGAKSILDIEKTMEYLETQGVTVATYGNSNEFPAFFTPRSGFMSPWTVSTPESAAAMIYANQMLKLSSGIVLAVPIPEEYAALGQPIQEAIDTAILEARGQNIRGKDETPFLLRRVNELTGGESLKSNIALIKNNAAIGSQIAVRLTELQFSKEQETESHNMFEPLSVTLSIKPKHDHDYENDEPKDRPLMIIGGTVIDITATISPSVAASDSPPSYMHTSMRGRVQQSLGGVGRNIAETAWRVGAPTVFISAVGGDIGGQWVRKTLEETGMDSSYLMNIESEMTAVYNALHDSQGQLISAVADMNIFDAINPEELRDKIRTIRPSLVCFDGNLSGSAIRAISDECAKLLIPAFFEPTSVPKSLRLFDHLETLFSGAIRYASPNEFELEAMSQRARELGFEKYLGKEFKQYNKAEWLEAFSPDLHSHIAHAYYLSHFIPHLIIKLGHNGVLLVEKDLLKPTTFTHIKALQIDPSEIRNVTGAGDSFVGTLLANLHHHGVSISNQQNIFSNILKNAQKAAVMTLKSDLAVSVEIGPELRVL